MSGLPGSRRKHLDGHKGWPRAATAGMLRPATTGLRSDGTVRRMTSIAPPSPLAALAAEWPRLEALLDQALDLPSPDRSAWLQSLPAEALPLRDSLAGLLALRAGP